jgi:hypothetical protein
VVTARDYLEYPTEIEWLDPALVLCEDRLAPMGEPGSFTNPKFSYLGEKIPNEDVVHIPWFQLAGPGVGAVADRRVCGDGVDWLVGAEVLRRLVPSRRRAAGPVQEHDADGRSAAGEHHQAASGAVDPSHEPIVYGKDWEYEPTTVSPRMRRSSCRRCG